MKNYLYLNGGVYRCKMCPDTTDMVIVFSAFSDEGTVLILPLSQVPVISGSPIFFGDTLMHAMHNGITRIKRDWLMALVGVVENASLEALLKNVFSTFRGNSPGIEIPTVTLLTGSDSREDKPKTAMDTVKNEADKEKGSSYSLEDYKFILDNYHNGMDMLLVKYNLKDKAALYRLRYALKRKFESMDKDSSEASENTHNTMGEALK